MYSYSHEPPVIVWCLLFLCIIIFTFIFGAIMQGIWGIQKDNVKQKKRRRMEQRRHERYQKKAQIKAKALEAYDLFEDYEAFDEALRRSSVTVVRRNKERFRVSITQLYSGNDLARGERVERTKKIYFDNREYRPVYSRPPYHERYPSGYTGYNVDCRC